jgi:ubiquinone/menaquinone biosynthesis C-methylase UbiE
MPVNKHFDWIAPLYDRLIPPTDPERLRSLLNLPPGGGWLLDAAGGTGRVAAFLCPFVDHYVISDLSAAMLRQATSVECVHPTQAKVEQLPFADEAFTRILVVDAFHHFGDQKGAVLELARVLTPGGRLVIEEPDIRHFSTKMIALGETLLLMDSHFRNPDWMGNLLTSVGLKVNIICDNATVWIIGDR